MSSQQRPSLTPWANLGELLKNCPEPKREAGSGVKLLYPHIDQSLDGTIIGRRDCGLDTFLQQSNSQRWIAAEGPLLAVLPATAGVSAFFLKGGLGGAAQYPPQEVMT